MNRMMRQERQIRGWTQAYVARQIGVTRTAVHDMEKGKQNPSYLVLVKLEALFAPLTHRELFAPAPDDPNLSPPV